MARQSQWFILASVIATMSLSLSSSQAGLQPPGGGDVVVFAQPPGGPPGFGPGGRGGPFAAQRKVLKQFDKNGDGWLNQEERKPAREFVKKQSEGQGGPRRFGPPGGFGGEESEPAKPGPKVAIGDVQTYPTASLYEPTILRTLFLEFDNNDWEKELEDFHGTDVDVPANLIVDGKKYQNVGVHFRGMSSYMGVRAGHKRSLNVAVDMADSKQKLHGHHMLNLLNSHEDATFLSSVLYSHIARQYIPAPKVNLVKVVINGESWGVYANAEQFNKDFLKDNFKSTKGTRWKVRGSPGGGGGLEYLGDNVEDYKRRFEIKSKDDDKAWQALIKLCKVLNETPPDKLEAALQPLMDIDNLLWFLALDVALINCDGYWIRASDYSLYLDEKGKFHFIPADMNEAFRPPMGPGMGGMMRMPPPGDVLPTFVQDTLRLSDEQKKQVTALQKDVDARLEKILNEDQRAQLKRLKQNTGPTMAMGSGPGGPGGRQGGPGGGRPGGPPGGPGGGPGGPPGMMGGPPGMMGGMGGRGPANVELDPLTGLDDSRKPLRSKVLTVPSLRARYLQNIKTIAEKSLDWQQLGPVVAQYRSLIDAEVKADTRKLETYANFQRLTAPTVANEATPGRMMGGMNLRAFAEQRRKYLLNHPEVKKAGQMSKQ